MSDGLYTTRLRWYGYSGVAKLHNRVVALHAPPLLPGLTVVSLDYVPEIGLRMIQARGEPMRDMTPLEVAAADEILRVVAGA